MPSESTFLNVLRGDGVSRYMGISVAEGEKLNYGKDYLYVTFPASKAFDGEGKPVKKLKAGESYSIRFSCGEVAPKKFRMGVEIPTDLYVKGDFRFPRILEEVDAGELPFYVTPHTDLDVKESAGRS